MKKYIIWLLLPLGFLFSCSDEGILIKEKALISYKNILNYSSNEAKMAFSYIGMDTVHPDVLHNFKVYEVVYKTYYNEQQIEASAYVAIPSTDKPVSIISFQHGTIVGHQEAPSKNLLNQVPLFSLASTGYIVVLPEYIGFGTSEDYFHPYYIADIMGESIYYAIKASLDIPEVKGNFNGYIFLAGYSEGGYATMAAHKYIEENTDLKVKASAPASGGYDVKEMQEYYFDQEYYDQPFYMAFVALAYKNYYGWDDDLNLFFNEPYASKLESLFDGSKTGSQINQELTEKVADFIQADALENFDTSDKYMKMANALKENSLTNWAPKAPVYLYHGTADVTVPFENSVSTYEKLLLVPDNSEKIQFFPIENKTHTTGILPYVKDVYYRFKVLK